ncbi:stage II sporulation protein M [Salinibacterium hongtaonis]|uniref:Stage II sporulation protein M n=1 Tax=Homoserinimonas hongtaonis TaxID=2079791 RepID=A0A2U1SWZ8_9MICO|nr:stage II sporulation protein M [Salinibacterium hongtaonis]PWB96073.1 hypothetical protein DF220_11825 [Salinibacterium hongtaonis]
MDIDAYAAAHRDEWNDLARLGAQRRFSGAEADELIERYQAGATDLSALRTATGSSVQADRLSVWLARARLRFTGASANVLTRLPVFFGAQLPAALYRIRWLTLAVTLATAVTATLFAWWALANPAVMASFGTEDFRRQFAEEDFVNYYSEHSPSSFTGLVWTNNAWIAVQCIAFGIVGVYVPYLILANAQNLGLSAAMMADNDRLDVFFLYISPHGQLELYAIFVAAAAGLAIFWSWVAPGARRRATALAEEGRALITVAVGVTLALLLSGVIEGFITRLEWFWPIKIGIGTLALGVFLAYQWGWGKRAFQAGETGDLDEFEGGARQLVAG